MPTLHSDTADCVKTKIGVPLENITQFTVNILVHEFLTLSKILNLERHKPAWIACNKLQKIWKSFLGRKLKINIFRACVESILLYGSETWTITKKLEDRINGCYTQLLRRVLNVSWRDHIPNKEIYGTLPPYICHN